MEIKPFRLLAAERCWGWEIAGLERKRRGAHIRWGWEGKCITFTLVLSSEIGCRLKSRGNHTITWGRGQWVWLLPVLLLLVFPQAGVLVLCAGLFYQLVGVEFSSSLGD